MSKDVVIAGVIVAACLGLVVVAFALPGKKPDRQPDPVDTSLTSTGSTPILPDSSGTSGFDNSLGNGNTAASNSFGTDPGAYNTGLGGTSSNGFGTTGGTSSNGFGTTGGTSSSSFGTTGGTSSSSFGTSNGGPIHTPVGLPVGGPPVMPPPTFVDPAPPVSTGERSHVVAQGETLGDISMKYYNTSKNWKKIAEANKGVDPNGLQVGTKLIIPEVAAVTPPAGGTATDTPAAGGATYKIKSGDTYYTVAKKELGSAARWKELEKLNKIAPEDLRVGMTIKLPAKPEAAPVVPGVEIPGGTPIGGGTDVTNGRTHVVAGGETLGDISKKHYGTTTKWREIAKANPGIEPESLKVGQKLVIPEIAGLKPASGSEVGSPAVSAPVGGAEYVIKPGDLLDEIAQKQLGKRSDAKRILEANPGLDPRRLRIGQKIIIPGKSGGSELPLPSAGGMPVPSDGLPTFGNGGGNPGASIPGFGPPPTSNPEAGWNPWLPPPVPAPAPGATGSAIP